MRLQNSKLFFSLKIVLGEIGLILVLSIVFWLLGRGTPEKCLLEGVFIMSLVAMCHLGIETFDALVQSGWKHKIANYRYYPVYQAFVLIAINAIICPITMRYDKWYVCYVYPICIWVAQIIISTWHKWTR